MDAMSVLAGEVHMVKWRPGAPATRGLHGGEVAETQAIGEQGPIHSAQAGSFPSGQWVWGEAEHHRKVLRGRALANALSFPPSNSVVFLL